MSEETIKKYKRKYKNELMTYTFPENYYDITIKNENNKYTSVNERRNINVIKNTPKDFYLFEGKFIYYEGLKKINNHINEWIQIFIDKVKYVDEITLIYNIYMEIINYISKEINIFIEEYRSKYNITYPIVPDTLIKNYIDILMGRKLKIANNLRIILENEFNLYYGEYSKEILDLFNYYQGKILSIEEENIKLYDEFRKEINDILNKPKTLVKEKKEN